MQRALVHPFGSVLWLTLDLFSLFIHRISKKDKESGELRHISVNACLMPALAADGCHVTTVEGVGTVKDDNLHPIQKAMVEMHGSQCGFCTPGIIVAIYSLYANKCNTKEIEEHMDGNLCRCTGYRPIWDAARSLCDDAEELVRGPCGTPCRECNERDVCEQDCNLEDKKSETIVITSSKDKMKMKESLTADTPDWIEQPKNMFPADLLDASSSDSLSLTKPLMVVDNTEFHGAGTWFKPTTLVGLLKLLKEFGEPVGGGYKIVVGNTEVGIGKLTEQSFCRLVAYILYSVLMQPSIPSRRNTIQEFSVPSPHLPRRNDRVYLSGDSHVRQGDCWRMYTVELHSARIGAFVQGRSDI
jgi:[2Fe-2S] binding domain